MGPPMTGLQSYRAVRGSVRCMAARAAPLGAARPRRWRPAQWAADKPAERAVGDEAVYRDLLQRAEEATFTVPAGDAQDAIGDERRAALQEGERLLARAVELRPREALPRIMLLRNLMIQDQGREVEVPGMALDALRELAGGGDGGGAGGDLTFTPAFVPAMQAMLLALKALYKLDQESLAPELAAAAGRLAPSMARDFESLAARVDGQLCGCGPGARAELLGSHRYLSCVDLQFVNGLHHLGSPGLADQVDLLEEGECALGA
ncbi:MAG: hypothetical protein J3K34DRAFT_523678 [Monoraphidium minutum]|nr:MAG: hypothetical protein J3K34DRAFT_523678 [Monoraphidium minutum]